MCDCGILSPVFPFAGAVPQSDVSDTEISYEECPFWTYSLKYCNNPRRHIFGSCPQCCGLKVAKGCVDLRDIAIPLKNDDPLQPPYHLRQPQFSPIF